MDAMGFGYPAADPVSRRRYNVARSALGSRPTWDVPSDYATPNASPAAPSPSIDTGGGWHPPAASPVVGAHTGAGTYGSSGDPVLDWVRNQAMADAGGRIRGARLSASDSVGADPALSGYASLSALIRGQGDATQAINGGALSYALAEKKRRDEEAMMRLQMQLQEEAQRRANSGAWLGDLGQLVGGVGGAWLAPGGLFSGAGRG